ncbi:MAG: DUF429 domain-containing protein [bacterium]|nr:DUF429 domain-containing protein [bacterium]
MRVLGVELALRSLGEGGQTLVVLDTDGRVETVEQVDGLPGVAAAAARLVSGEPFLLGVDIPVVVPAKPARGRPVEGLARRRFGHRLPPGGRLAPAAQEGGIAGEALIAGLAAAGLPCLPYPDRDRRQSGLAEVHPGLVLKSLLWQSSDLTATRDAQGRDELFRAFSAPAYRTADLPARASWADQAVALDLLLRLLDGCEFDLTPAREALRQAASEAEVEAAAGLLDALLIAGTARRYLESPEQCLFLGDQTNGYVILPADAFIRRLAQADVRPQRGELFPQASLRERLGRDAKLRSPDLLSVPGRAQRLEASFEQPPRYEFDNLDEMVWWKHCRHLAGPPLPTEGLHELAVHLEVQGGAPSRGTSLRLVRSRHRTLSFRFEPPTSWRSYVPTRDGKTYAFEVLNAVYETLPD